MRLIDADYLKEFAISIGDGVCDIDVVPISDFDYAPTIDPVKHGHWTGIEYDGYADGYPVYTVWECSVCGNEVTEDTPLYCCDCGARMDEEVSE